MAFEPGGMADKLGNRYEGRWVAKQLLMLLDEEIQSLTIELIGPNEQGVDLLVVKKNGVQQLQQCKARLANNENWTVAHLQNKGILHNLKTHLLHDPKQEFALISPIPAINLADICESARNSNNCPKDFYQYQILDIGSDRREIFQKFCNCIGLDLNQGGDIELAFNYLKRTSFELFSDDQNSWSDILTFGGFLLTGKPETAISALLTYADNKNGYHKPIYPDELRQYLREIHGIFPKQLQYDQRIGPAIENLQNEFSETILPGLICNKIIPRSETAQIIEFINNGQDVVLHGAAGNGKSGVLYELTEYLKNQKTPYIPVRLDRRIPNANAKLFGEEMGLPESPTNCLVGLAAGRRCVLILDQLDAIRWTTPHSSTAMNVCKELVRQAISLRREEKKIVIVFACRTFDLENDPEIKSLFSQVENQSPVQIPINVFSDEQLKGVLGDDIAALTDSQRKILSTPHNLAIWMELKQEGIIPEFRSTAELMRRFWENRRQILEQRAGIPTEHVNEFLHHLINYMEDHGEVSAPIILTQQNPRAQNVLISYGILQKSQSRISFCHQRYLDYLIAERLLIRIYEKSGSIKDWLDGKEKQTLFRREQLRQVLASLADTSQIDYLNNIRILLASEDVRFHLKHLILEMIGQLDEITEEIGNYCLALVGDDYWREHIFETVFLGHHQWVLYLLKAGAINEWLSSSDEEKVNQTLWLLRSVAEYIPDQVTEILSPLVNAGEMWPGRVLNGICWRESDDSDLMFELRLQLLRLGYAKNFVDWNSLCTQYPLRALRFLEAVVSTLKVDREDEPKQTRSRLVTWYDHDLEALCSAVKRHPIQTWDLLMPHVEKFTSEQIYANERINISFSGQETGIVRGLVNLLTLAGQLLASEQTDKLITRTTSLVKSSSPVVQEIILEAYSRLPESYAHEGIKWLLADLARFQLGLGYKEPEWIPAVRLITALSPFCTESLFRNLEDTIIHYHTPKEKKMAEYFLKGWKEGWFGHYWGEAQYFLLPALDSRRIRTTTADLIRVLERKFNHYPKDYFLRCGHSSGGWVGSKLDPNLDKISDQAWLKIVNNQNIGKRGNHKWIQVDSDRVLEASIEQFAQSLARIAQRFPERFGQLALKFPETIDPRYISSILGSLKGKQPGNDVPESEKKTWEPALIETIEGVLDKYQSRYDREIALAFCWLIAERADENWTDKTIARLVNYACNHPDPENDSLTIYADKKLEDATIEMLFQNTINCVRGTAAGVIGKLLWNHPDWMEKVLPGIKFIIHDPNPVVRMAALDAIYPVLNIDKDLAVHWFCEACEDDLRVAASPHALPFFNYIIPSHIDLVKPIIQKMVKSNQDEVVLQGASQVTARWLFFGYFENEFKECLMGTSEQRKGVAKVAVHLLKDEQYSGKCQEILYQFMNDPDKNVRLELHSMLNNNHLFNKQEFQAFIKTYIKSQAFADNPDLFIMSHKDSTTNLIFVADAIFSVCEVLSTSLMEKTRDISSRYPYLVSEISAVLLRLYDQAQGEQNHCIADRCLDIWDLFFENRVGRTIELTKAIEQ